MRPAIAALLAIACSSPARPPEHHPAPVATKAHTITIIGTNDLHGALERLPLLAGFVANMRAARAADGGVLLVDAGDLFQGTLESNLAEGADVIRAYNQMGYAASAIGNHEFDYGPVGPPVTAKSPDEDPRGALKARISEAKFPFLVANIVDDKSSERLAWPNLAASVLVDVAGTRVGIVGASTQQTPYTTMPANFVGLKMAKTGAAIAAEAKALRDKGAQVVVLIAHIGSACKQFDKPDDVSSCDRKEELFDVLADIPTGLVDVMVAGHTHAAIAHRINGVAVIESYSSGRAFGRVDLRVEGTHVTDVTIHKPEVMCPLDKEMNPASVSECHPGPYEGKPVQIDTAVQKIVDDAIARAGEHRNERLGVALAGPITKSYGSESVEGDWFTDLMVAASPTHVDLALTNGGGLRADIPGGDLTYGKLFEAMPFDNRFAIVAVKGKHLRKLVTTNLQRGGAIFSWSGLTAKARCKSGELDVAIEVHGKPLTDDASYTLATSDFLASGGDGVIGRLKLPDGAIKPTDVIIRDAMADVLRKQKGTIEPDKIYSKTKKRMDYEGKRPIECAGAKPSKPDDGE